MSGSALNGEPGHRHKLWLGANTLAKRENRKIRAHEARILRFFPIWENVMPLVLQVLQVPQALQPLLAWQA